MDELLEEKPRDLRDVVACYGAAVVCVLVAIGLIVYALVSL